MPGKTKEICCGKKQRRPGFHWRVFHQATTKIYFANNHGITVKRNQQTKRFHCPRCDEECFLSKDLTKHIVTGRCYRSSDSEHSSANGSDSDSEYNPSNREGSKSSALSRSRRAKARRLYYADGYNLREVADRLQCTHLAASFAVHNKESDNLNEDPKYFKGKTHAVNVHTNSEHERTNVDLAGTGNKLTHLSGKRQSSGSSKKPSTSSSRAKPASTIPSQQPSTPDHIGDTDANHHHAVDDTGPSSSRSATNQKRVRFNPYTHAPDGSSVASNSLIHFLKSLAKPCPHLLDSFGSFGIKTVDELEVFYRALPAKESQFQEYIPEMSLFEWFVVGRGLDRRRERAHE